MVKVLCLCYDKRMAEERRVALKKAGFEVLVTTVVEQARMVLRRERADVVVVGHHFSDAETDDFITEARKLWGATVVVVTCIGAEPDARADVSVPVLAGVEGMVRAVEVAVSRLVAAS